MLLAVNWPISLDRPVWLWLLLTIPVIVAISMRSLAGLDRYRRITAIVLRSLVIAALAIALARIEYVKRNRNVAVMFVLDRSRSIPDELRTAAQNYIKQVAKHADRDDQLGVIGFDGEADIDLIPSRGGFDVQSFGMQQEGDRTDIAAGLRLAMAAFPQGYARRAVILTDGNQNVGDLKEEIENARAGGIAVDVVPLQYQYDNEILFDRITVPSHANRDTKVPVRLIVKSRRPAKARLTLYHGDEEVPLSDPILTLTGGMKPDPFTIPIQLHAGGIHRFDARITPIPDSADSIAENNKATAFTFVEDQGRVLILTQPGSTDDKVLFDALTREKVDVEMRGVDQFSVDLLSLQEHGVVILANVSADTFNEEQHKALASYVRDFGGGLIMTGGNEGFGAGGWIGKPLEEISPVSFEVKHTKKLPQGALAIIMHSCEIARGDYWGVKVAVAAVETLSTLDYVGLIDYNFRVGGPHWEVPMQLATNKPAIIQKVKAMQNGDMPSFEDLMSIVVRDMMKLPNVSQRHVIVISDGDPAPPKPQTIQQYVANQITVSTVGIGYGSHVMDATLKSIAAQTGGRFYACKNPMQLPQIFIKEAKVVKRQLIDEHEFRPRLAYPSQTTQGLNITEIPPLGGLVITTPKPDALIPIVRHSDDGPDPVLAHWNFEMGKMVAFTSGWWPKWGADWASWEQFGKLWAQVVRWAMRQTGSADFDIVTRVEGTKGRVAIEALNKDASYLNFLHMEGLVVTPSAEKKKLEVTQTGPGQYEGTFDVSDHGNYLVSLHYSDPEHDAGMINTGVSVSYSPEFRELGANVPLLQQAAERTGGRTLSLEPDVKKVFSRDLPPSVSRQPVWRWVIQWLLLPLFLLDVAARRLASVAAMSIYVEIAIVAFGFAIMYSAGALWWGYVGVVVFADLVGWMIRWRSIGPAIQFVTGGVSALAGQRSAEALSQLKDVREKVREELVARSAEGRKPATISLDAAADPKARFDAGEPGDSDAGVDLTKAVGGADAVALAEEEKAKKRTAAGKQPGQEDMTSRLMKAKRRAQDEMKERTEE